MTSNSQSPLVWDARYQRFRRFSLGQRQWVWDESNATPSSAAAVRSVQQSSAAAQPSSYTLSSGPAYPSTYSSAASNYSDRPVQTSNLATTTAPAEIAVSIANTVADQITQDDAAKEIIERNGHFDSRYKSSWNEFRFGLVFKILWFEPAGIGAKVNNKDTFAHPRYPDQLYFSKPLWFVVIREFERSCLCLPINTHGGHGVANQTGMTKHHAIIYTGRMPSLTTQEQGALCSLGMKRPIKVIPIGTSRRLDPMSRVNFSKVTSVERHAKILIIGHVSDECNSSIREDFTEVFLPQTSPQYPSTQLPESLTPRTYTNQPPAGYGYGNANPPTPSSVPSSSAGQHSSIQGQYGSIQSSAASSFTSGNSVYFNQQTPSGYHYQQPPSGYSYQQTPSGYPYQQPTPGYPYQQPPSGNHDSSGR